MVALAIDLALGKPVLGLLGENLPDWVPKGAKFYLDALNRRAFVNGSVHADFASLLAAGQAVFSRPGAGMYASANGSLASFASEQMRLGDKGLLIEPEGVNYNLDNAAFNTSWYHKSGVTVTIDAVSAPDGATSAELIREDASEGLHRIFNDYAMSATLDPLRDYCASVYVRAMGARYLLFNANTVLNAHLMLFDLQTGEITGNGDAGIEVCANGWRRCWIHGVTSDPVAENCIYLQINRTGIVNDEFYAGDNSSGFYLWGMQVEPGHRPSTPIGTTNASATRPADRLVLKPVSGVYDIAVTFDDDSTRILPSQTVTDAGWEVPTDLPRAYIKSITGF